MVLGTLDARGELKIEKPVAMTVAESPVRSNGDGNRDDQEWADLRSKSKIESKHLLMD